MPDGDIGEAVVKKYFKQEDWEKNYILSTTEIKRIAHYTGLNFMQVLNLPFGAYLIYRKESWIDVLNKTEDGRELLKNLWRLSQTKADLTAVRQKTR
ncbi:hypothetical protein FYJ53_05970 [Eubacterium sp. BL-380-WT-2B]|nr:hypothetical protein [Eubacterium sp. BL-380-WT-2B]